MHRCDGRSFCGRGPDTNLAVRGQQKARQAFSGVGINFFQSPILTKCDFVEETKGRDGDDDKAWSELLFVRSDRLVGTAANG